MFSKQVIDYYESLGNTLQHSSPQETHDQLLIMFGLCQSKMARVYIEVTALQKLIGVESVRRRFDELVIQTHLVEATMLTIGQALDYSTALQGKQGMPSLPTLATQSPGEEFDARNN